MVWFKVDDGFYSSSKVLSIPRTSRLAAVGLWLRVGDRLWLRLRERLRLRVRRAYGIPRRAGA